MPGRRERLLLLILGAVSAISAAAIVVGPAAQRLQTARATAAQCALLISRLERSSHREAELASTRDRLRSEIAGRVKHLYEPGEMNAYAFGTLIHKRLVSQGLTIARYQVIERTGAGGLEFSVSGSVNSLVLFLREVSESDKQWSISSLSITMREGTATADAVFRIGYELSAD